MEIVEKLSRNQKAVRCFSFIGNERDKMYGLRCNKILIYRNSTGQVAGEIKCTRCGAIYDITDNKMILVRKETK